MNLVKEAGAGAAESSTPRESARGNAADAGARVDEAALRYQSARAAHWDAVAHWMDERRGMGGAYQQRLAEVYKFFIPEGARVLEVGCARGDLLAALKPSVGVGLDFSAEMLERARERHTHLRFVHADAHDDVAAALEGERFDYIILSDVVNDLWDAQSVFEQLRRLSTARTRVILNFYNRLWEMPLALARRARLARPNLEQNWFTLDDITSLLALSGFEVIRHRAEILLPLRLPPVSTVANRYLAKLWPFHLLALTHFVVARPVAVETARERPVVSVVIPARNEAGNVPDIFARVPELGAGTEMVFVEGGSKDDTFGAIEREMAAHPERRAKLLRQTGRGKGDAVRLGFREATGDVLMILDSDLTVPPEDLPRFLEVLTTGKADFVNGSRLVYPMEGEAMRFANLVGNKFFSLAFSWLLGQPVKDTLCGTKVLWRDDYERLAEGRHYFGDFDPFGDFDLLFGASKLGLKILDLPVRYRDRTYGETNIQRWSHGLLLLRMVAFAARRIKFI
ncbi:MAG TPA: glycosyltransferase [Pyrinomonadaceae bacterium]|nr:glycosyltransferase [Pyrinomonadaceae bacterium]